MVYEVLKAKTHYLSFLYYYPHGLDYDDAEIIRKEKIYGRVVLKLTKKDFRDCGMPGGTAVILANFAKECTT
ncbi:hypothetical protein RhiirA5_412367 [Rhizophagus irregularis]|nr:hypothetical protein RhiirA5_412367 [Rhizophagus irregularis]PKC75724.1 hypothetical protein RhiirA1_448434 [Rhizophagus irregularis]